MYTKTIPFEDFDGNQRVGTFHFHINESEIMNKELSRTEGWSAWLENLVKIEDKAKLIQEFENFVLISYGVKDEDGLRFRKSEELRQAFKEHPAYGELVVLLTTNAAEASAFVNGVFPRNLRTKIQEVEKKAGKGIEELTMDELRALDLSQADATLQPPAAPQMPEITSTPPIFQDNPQNPNS